jgi:hypothetical protein
LASFIHLSQKNSICFLSFYCHSKTKIAGKKKLTTYNNNAAIKLFGKTKTSLVSTTNRKVHIRETYKYSRFGRLPMNGDKLPEKPKDDKSLHKNKDTN